MTRLQDGGGARAERLHVMVSRGCNNDCVFCLEDRSLRRKAHFGDPFDILERFFSREAVLFTCGEPTLHRDLVPLVARAAELGYRQIGLVTNGRLLGKDGLGRMLAEAGLTDVTLSIHSHRPEIHDRLVGRRAFLQTLHGLDVMASLGQVALKSSTVITNLNLNDLPQTVLFLAGRGVQVVHLNYIEPAGKAEEFFEQLAPRMSEVASRLSSLRGDCCRELVVTAIPPCILHRGPLSFGRREIIWHWKDGDFVRLRPDRGQTHGPACRNCSARRFCDGVWRKYVEVFGWGEFSPLEGPGIEGDLDR